MPGSLALPSTRSAVPCGLSFREVYSGSHGGQSGERVGWRGGACGEHRTGRRGRPPRGQHTGGNTCPLTPVISKGHAWARGRAWPRAQGTWTSCLQLGAHTEVLLFLKGDPPPREAGARHGGGLRVGAVLEAGGLGRRLAAALAPRPGRREGRAGDRLQGLRCRLLVPGRGSERVRPAGEEVGAREGRGKWVRRAAHVLLGLAPHGKWRQCRHAAHRTQNADVT